MCNCEELINNLISYERKFHSSRCKQLHLANRSLFVEIIFSCHTKPKIDWQTPYDEEINFPEAENPILFLMFCLCKRQVNFLEKLRIIRMKNLETNNSENVLYLLSFLPHFLSYIRHADEWFHFSRIPTIFSWVWTKFIILKNHRRDIWSQIFKCSLV